MSNKKVLTRTLINSIEKGGSETFIFQSMQWNISYINNELVIREKDYRYTYYPMPGVTVREMLQELMDLVREVRDHNSWKREKINEIKKNKNK